MRFQSLSLQLHLRKHMSRRNAAKPMERMLLTQTDFDHTDSAPPFVRSHLLMDRENIIANTIQYKINYQ